MSQDIDLANVPLSKPIVSLSITNEIKSDSCKEKGEKEDEDSTYLPKEGRRSKTLNTLENQKTSSQDGFINADEKTTVMSQIKKKLKSNDHKIKNVETPSRVHPSPHKHKPPAKERRKSPLRRRRGNSPARSPARRISERTIDEDKEWSNVSQNEMLREARAKMLQQNENYCESERPLNRPIFSLRSPLLPSETVRRTPSETFAACQAAFLHSTPDQTEIDEPILLPLQAEGSVDDDWLTDPVSSFVKAGPAACCLAETIEDRVASTSVLSLAGGSLCRLLPLGNVRPRLKKNESSSSSSSEVESIASDSSVCRRNEDLLPLGLPPLT